MKFKEFKEKFRQNVISVGYAVFTIVLAVVVFLGCGIFFLVFAFADNVADRATMICLLVFSGISFFSALLFAMVSPWLIAIYPKYKKLTHCFFQKSMFVTKYPEMVEERVAVCSEFAETRVLTVERRKSMVGCIGKLKICMEDACGEIELQGVRYRQIGILKNGEAKSFDIPTRACRICAFYDIVFAQRYGFACKELPEGRGDVSLVGKSRLSLRTGNSFLFE